MMKRDENRKTSQESLPSKLQYALFENGSYKIVALLITLILWVAVLGSRSETTVVEVGIDVKKPENMIFTNSTYEKITLRLSGPVLALKDVAKGIPSFEIDLKDVKPGKVIYPISRDKLKLPSKVNIIEMFPTSLTFDIDKISTKWLPIKVDWENSKEPSKVLEVIRIEPQGQTIDGAVSVLSLLTNLWTEPIKLSDIPMDRSKKVIEIRTQIKEMSFSGVVPLKDRKVSVFVKPK